MYCRLVLDPRDNCRADCFQIINLVYNRLSNQLASLQSSRLPLPLPLSQPQPEGIRSSGYDVPSSWSSTAAALPTAPIGGRSDLRELRGDLVALLHPSPSPLSTSEYELRRGAASRISLLSSPPFIAMSRGGRPMAKIANPFDSDSDSETTSRTARGSSAPAKNQHKNNFNDSGDMDNMSVQQLENYAVNKAEETTHKVNDCLRIAEVIREDASNTLVTLYAQGEQITRTHETAVKIDKDLTKGETLLGSLGGIFSKPWKAKKTRQIKGPSVTRDDSFKRKGNQNDKREKLGLSSSPRARAAHRHCSSDPPSLALEKVEIEKEKQDDGLSDLSDVLGQLKGMALDMGGELDRQNKALDDLQVDVEELNSRMKGANQRARKLVGK